MGKAFKSTLISLAALAVLSAAPTSQAEMTATRASFSIGFQGIISDLTTLTTTLMPGETIKIQTEADAFAHGGDMSRGNNYWIWTAPSTPGRETIEFHKDGQTMTLHVFVLTPFENSQNAAINGYKIGGYRKTLFKGLHSYAAPKGFIDLSYGPADLQISPHFTLGQFICKQQPDHDPTYLLVRAETLIKLETLLEAAKEKGWNADTLHVMSGFRTPAYNRSIGNKTSSSRHLYGGAADIWLDGDGDGRMDDLNGDGKVNKDDARALAKLAEKLAAKGGPNWPSGGIGVYGSNSAHGPFIHIDSRGYSARWGH